MRRVSLSSLHHLVHHRLLFSSREQQLRYALFCSNLRSGPVAASISSATSSLCFNRFCSPLRSCEHQLRCSLSYFPCLSSPPPPFVLQLRILRFRLLNSQPSSLPLRPPGVVSTLWNAFQPFVAPLAIVVVFVELPLVCHPIQRLHYCRRLYYCDALTPPSFSLSFSLSSVRCRSRYRSRLVAIVLSSSR